MDECQIRTEDESVQLSPYCSFIERFQQILKKGDPMLVHLMLKQATFLKDKRLTRQMLKSLVNHAVSVSQS